MRAHRLALTYVETRIEGPLFESMKAKLAGIASHAGMSGVFRLLGSDVFRVRSIELIPSLTVPEPTPERDLLSAVRRSCVELSGAGELDELLDFALDCLDRRLGIRHSMAPACSIRTRSGSIARLARLYALRRGLGSRARRGRHRRGGTRTHADPHRAHDLRVLLRHGRAR